MTLSTHIPEPDSSIRGSEQFTEDQLHFLRVSRQKAVHDALTRYIRGGIVAYVILVAALGYVLYADSHQRDERRADSIAARHQIVDTGNAVALAGCNRDFRTITSLRAVLTNARNFQNAALKRGDITQEQFDRATAYYKVQLSSLQLPDCRVAARTVSDNPSRRVPVETPLYPHG